MRAGFLILGACLPLLGCDAPDYSPVRDWARTASLAVDYPRAAAQDVTPPPGMEMTAPRGLDDGILAMQEALATYLQALATLASDGVLPYRDNPFQQLAPRAAETSAPGGDAVTALGQLLRRASRSNAQAPELRDTIRGADPQFQSLVSALKRAVSRQRQVEEITRQAAADFYDEVSRRSTDAAARQALREAAALRDAEFAEQAARRRRYEEILTRVGEDHALLKEKAGRVTREQVVQELRAAEARLRRAALGLRGDAP